MRSTGQSIHGLGTGLIFRTIAILGLALTATSSHAARVRVPTVDSGPVRFYNL